jgi:hypothetical protein
MHKLTNFAGGVRHGWEMPFGVNRSQHHDMPRNPQYQRPPHTPTTPTQLPHATPISWCFKVPLNNTLIGPDPKQIIYASQGASERWTHQPGSPDDTPTHLLPVHQQHLDDLRNLCARMKTELGVEAIVTLGRANTLAPMPSLQPTQTNNIVANVCVNGRDYDIVRRVREHILNQSPITMVSFEFLMAMTVLIIFSAIGNCSCRPRHDHQVGDLIIRSISTTMVR